MTGNLLQEFLDKQQYSTKGLLKYEEIFGSGFISTGGIQTTEEFFADPELQQIGQQGGETLDVGCGIGGGAVFIAKRFPNMTVHAVDLSRNCINVALQRYGDIWTNRVQFQVADILTCPLRNNHYSFIYSRDVILHIYDKLLLFTRLFDATKAGGMLFFTDYCQADDTSGCQPHALSEWNKYVTSRGYTLYSVEQYAITLRLAGWTVEKAQDQTAWFRKTLLTEMDRVRMSRSLSEEDQKELIDGWKAKIERIDAGLMKWGSFVARKEVC